MDVAYDFPLYRPPSEASSMIFQVTLGCSFNKCSFCNMYRSKNYAERPLEVLKEEIHRASQMYPETKRIFLADGDALNVETGRLLEILEYIRSKFPVVQRISCYAMPSNLLQKSGSELELLRNAGLTMLYIGIESGNDNILRRVTKGATGRTISMACKKARSCGFVISCMIILGLGGKKCTKQHIGDTARILNEVCPDYVGALTLHLEEPIREEFFNKFGEPFEPLEDIEVLDELEFLISEFKPSSPVVFRANHGSNVYSLGGTLPDDSDKLLRAISTVKSTPAVWRPKALRGF